MKIRADDWQHFLIDRTYIYNKSTLIVSEAYLIQFSILEIFDVKTDEVCSGQIPPEIVDIVENANNLNIQNKGFIMVIPIKTIE